MEDAAGHAVAVHTAIFVAGLLAFGLTARVVRFRSHSRKGAALLAIALVTGIALLLTFPKTPVLADLNGTYQNPCCDAVKLQDGALITATQKVPFKLELLKFGLIGNLSTPVEVRGRQVVAGPNASTNVLTFSNDLKALTICGAGSCDAGHEYEFVRR